MGSTRLRRVIFGVPPKISSRILFSPGFILIGGLRVQAGRLNWHAGRVHSHSCFGVRIKPENRNTNPDIGWRGFNFGSRIKHQRSLLLAGRVTAGRNCI